MRIIPAIDIIDGKCVRLTQGDYAQKKIYNESPLEVAKMFEDAGLRYLHLVDLDGAKAGKVVNWKVIEDLTTQTSMTIDFGGGIKTTEEISRLLEAGIRQVNLGSIAVKQPERVFDWIKYFGAEQIILSADVKDRLVQISGWQENASMTIDDLVSQYSRKGISSVVCTDIATDGMLTGPNVKLYRNLMATFPEIRWVASGGVSDIADLNELVNIGVDGVIIGKAIYEGKISMDQLANF
ncbi:MAG TPA: 1-(5-phosphoribosyl)-5-[(5-phosphoribosylamino)methylideneamino]imidazole-4-carboxamide isomerase [Chryseosolibacter sp.]